MSFLSVVLTKDFISVMADGMVSKLEDDKLTELKSDYKKFKKISQYQFVTFTGAVRIFENIIRKYSYKESPYDLEIVANEIKQLLLQEIRDNKLAGQVVVGGIQSGDIIAYAITSDNQINRLYKPTGSELAQLYLTSEYIDPKIKEDIPSLFIDFCKKTNNIEESQILLNRIVADNDPTVNNEIQRLLIEL
ncbi:hypothetical protein ICM_01397 [Bacillus cereus BAG1X2-3]|uniref:Uncharacterized protein n=1 Tax=Bacillus cereus TaxID=1396 RepID=A0A9X7E8I6_BACCE|nr:MULTISPECIES: hypothetical protein [Bacillus cereus group]EEK58811.1 hypothetical protein bcere0005_54850 [Bacillus cereus 172560W]EOO27130.1 hypothetical protein ICC_03421 [Bacillus cereus BAG1X1-1]EOO49442.1 hypothetical protein ICI_01960 [Bacillus cereus BAG1X2-1]EOO51552.1 hypothetical protein ICK_03392 [Bacillus cereus BAG1X2-2]EOO60477.1 hypothetical protein ICM_01397 [Bacillus cereus BAG1X2-3]